MRSNTRLQILLATGLSSFSSITLAAVECGPNCPPVEIGCGELARCLPVDPCQLNPQACAPVAPTAPSASADEAKRTINLSEQDKFVDPTHRPKSGGLIEFRPKLKDNKSKVCS